MHTNWHLVPTLRGHMTHSSEVPLPEYEPVGRRTRRVVRRIPQVDVVEPGLPAKRIH